MLNKENRLLTNFEFNITRKYGDKYANPLFHVYVLKPINYEGPTKIGIVVSSKLAKNAVTRNRTKRVFREVIKSNLDKFGNNLWIVLHPSHDSLDKGYEEISTEFNKTLQKISIPC